MMAFPQDSAEAVFTACLNKFRLNSSFLPVNRSLGFVRLRMLQQFFTTVK